jgi:hypothetical protein
MPAYGEVKIMPEELVESATRNNCRQISDFFDRPGMVKPPYVYGYALGREQDSAAFWCERIKGDKRQFVLMFRLKNESNVMARCPKEIEWMNPPRGLDLYQNRRESLADFVFISEPRERGPREGRMKYSAIRSEYDGVEEVFYCHEGRWMVRQKH